MCSATNYKREKIDQKPFKCANKDIMRVYELTRLILPHFTFEVLKLKMEKRD